jgi:outer membrane lipoprotein-sorting protein
MRPLTFLLALLAVVCFGISVHAQTAQEIIGRTDKVRNPGQPFRSTNVLTEYVAGAVRNQSVIVVYAKEDGGTRQFRDLIRYTEPPRDSGKMALFSGRVLWFYDPTSKTSVRISPQQRLLGQASINDVLTTNLVVDYNGTILADETVQDGNRQNHQCWHLDLVAASEEAPYNHVEYWVEHGTYFPIKVKFYSDSGRLLKILYYRGFREVLGAVRPTEAIVIDAVDSSLVTKISFNDFRFQDIPETWFQRDFLPRLKTE